MTFLGGTTRRSEGGKYMPARSLADKPLDRLGDRARRGRGREADIAQWRATVDHLRKQHGAAVDKGNTALAVDIEGRIQRILARIERFSL